MSKFYKLTRQPNTTGAEFRPYINYLISFDVEAIADEFQQKDTVKAAILADLAEDFGRIGT